MAVGMLMAYGYFHRGLPWPSDAGRRVWQVLGVSGFLGFFVSDLCLFKAFSGHRAAAVAAGDLAHATHGGSDIVDVARRRASARGRGWRCPSRWPAYCGWCWSSPTATSIRYSRKAIALRALSGRRGHRDPVGGHGTGERRCCHYDPAASALIRILGALVGYVLLITLLGRWRPMVAASRRAQADAHCPRRGRGRAGCRRIDCACWPCRIATKGS